MIFQFPLLRAALIAMLCMAGNVAAHEGHDHADKTKTLLQAGSSARVEAASGPFELVALLQKGELVIYLDRFETNVPITAALITVETPLGPIAAQAKEGTYRLAAPWAQVDAHDLIFTVTAEGHTEILSGTLRVAATAPEASKSGGWASSPPLQRTGSKRDLAPAVARLWR